MSAFEIVDIAEIADNLALMPCSSSADAGYKCMSHGVNLSPRIACSLPCGSGMKTIL